MVDPSVVPKVKLNDGMEIPILGLGTWKAPPGEVGQAVKYAIDAGYRHFDCAWMYKNENEVGQAIKEKIAEGVVKREELFIVSKLWNTFHRPEHVEPALRESLKALGLDYLDLYLIHFPTDFKYGDNPYPLDENGKAIREEVDYVDTWKAMEEVYKKGLARSIGVSNFSSKQIGRILATCSIEPVTNQVECHPYLNQRKLLEFCYARGITLTAYSPLGSPNRPYAKRPTDPTYLEDSQLQRVADKYNKTIPQVLIRYQIQRGIITIPKSINKKRIEENIKVFDFQLSQEDMNYLDSFDCNGRIFSRDWATNHPHDPFYDEY